VQRTTSKGERRYHVARTLGGRREHGGRVLHLGSFRTKREAEACVKWANLELAAARIPDRRAFLAAQLEATGTLRDTAEAWLKSRRDLAESTRAIYATHIQRGAASRLPLWDYPAGRITVADVLAFVDGLVEAQAAPASMRNYLSMVRQTLDFAGVDPNPTRDRRVKLPSAERHQPDPPTSREVALILEHSTKRYRLVIALLEATGLRVSELVGLAWGDVDLAESRFRIARGKTKAARRFVSVPHELMEHVAALCPLEDRRADRRVFRVERGAVANAMAGLPERWHPRLQPARPAAPARQPADRAGRERPRRGARPGALAGEHDQRHLRTRRRGRGRGVASCQPWLTSACVDRQERSRRSCALLV
jgi:integrase